MPANAPQNTPPFFGVKVSKPGVPVNQATPSQLVYSNNYDTTTFYDGSNSRIALGQLPDGSYGMWVSKPGFNVTDTNAATDQELIFNSDQDVLKVVQSGDITLTTGGSAGDFQVSKAHGLSFTPAPIGYLISISGAPLQAGVWFELPFVQHQVTTGSIDIAFIADIAVDATNIYVNVSAVSAFLSQTYVFKYYLLQEALS